MIPWYWMIGVAVVFGIGGFMLCSLFIANERSDPRD